ncbi:fumarylacetoacetate hydrolase family protein [Blastopirellula retiformator]|uniref:Ureidoglycolate lyase n=1 Tax=Blastopirellula retiformator TaxID=2527970 RepID=A0A5C5VJF1_9BACT|nr:fumarylacetoacetate hydrolase family protein [Blastopirellula retiformator]TWT38728.1 Ureidoglycolate lyase [Blastopirellula retiformator]
MRLVTYQSEAGPRAAIARGDDFIDLHHTDHTLPTDMKSLLAMGHVVRDKVLAAAEQGEPIPQGSRILTPIVNPQKVICVGLNYADHAKETGGKVGDEPVIFNKFPSALIADHDEIHLPPESDQVDYEAELVVVIGSPGKHIPQGEAMSHVGGYCCGNDISARDWQKGKPGKQWLLGKTFDTFAPLGSVLYTPDEIGDPHNLAIRMRLNGETMQESSTSQLIFKIDFLISYLSNVVMLQPGDLIYTGTPHGVGVARDPQVFLQPGDQLEVDIEGLGVLTNRVAIR